MEAAGTWKGCPNQSICASGKAAEPDPDLPLIAERLSQVKHIVLVLSGKGGVGKSTVTANLAYGLARNENIQVGVLDLDICGPSLPKIFGVEGEQVHMSNSGWSPVYPEDNIAMISVGFLVSSASDAIIKRGPKKNDLVKKFLLDVDWGELDYLLVDTPPGTSDEHISLAKYLQACRPDGCVIVTTPQEVALMDVRREIDFCRKVGLPLLGVVENMSGFVCPKCTNESAIFPATTGGAERLCTEAGTSLLGRLPLDPRIARCCDEGKSFYDTVPDSPATKAYLTIVEGVMSKCEQGPNRSAT